MPAKLLTINIRNYLVKSPRSMRQRRLSHYVRDRVAHYMKLKLENVKIDSELNKALVRQYSKSMLPLKTNVNIDNGIAKVSLYSNKPVQQAAAAKPEKKQSDQKTKESPAKSTNTASAKEQPQAKAPEKSPKPATKPAAQQNDKKDNDTEQKPKQAQ